MHWAGKENTNRVGVRRAPPEQRRLPHRGRECPYKGTGRRERDSGAFWEPVRGEEAFFQKVSIVPTVNVNLASFRKSKVKRRSYGLLRLDQEEK